MVETVALEATSLSLWMSPTWISCWLCSGMFSAVQGVCPGNMAKVAKLVKADTEALDIHGGTSFLSVLDHQLILLRQESVRVDDQPNYWRDSDGRIIGQTGGGTYYRTENRHRSAGRAGRNGQHGATPMDQLYPGRNGPPGTAMIVVKHGDSLVTYPSRYWLQVIGFDLKDENDDGIFEPGEHVFISNIKVQNTGMRISERFYSELTWVRSDANSFGGYYQSSRPRNTAATTSC